MMGKKRRVLLIAIFVIASAAIIGGLRASSKGASRLIVPQTATVSPPKKAEEQFKNIQVLKGIPAEELLPTMQFVASSLGVNCEYCHVKNAFEKDDKDTKKTARKMMEMMFTINQENFDGRRDVTCYSCHRGNAKPVAIPAVMAEDSAMAPAIPHGAPETNGSIVKEAPKPTPEQLLDKYLQAIGGSAAIDKITSRVMKGTIEFGGQAVPIDIYAKDPDMRISFTHMPGGDSVTAFNGHEGWLGTPGRPPHFMQGSEIDAASMDADLHLAAHLKQMFTKTAVEGTDKVGERNAYVLVGQREAKTPIRLYFDEKTGLLLRLIRYGETALGWLPTQIDYADYRDANGLNIPYRWTLARPNGRFTIQLSQVQQNVPVDDAKFATPVPEPPKEAPTGLEK